MYIYKFTACGVSGVLYGLLCSITGCQCIYSCFYREKMRGQYSLLASPCADCLVHFCCEGCALCQEYRELKNRGFDMTIGSCRPPSLWVQFKMNIPNYNFLCLSRMAGKYGEDGRRRGADGASADAGRNELLIPIILLHLLDV